MPRRPMNWAGARQRLATADRGDVARSGGARSAAARSCCPAAADAAARRMWLHAAAFPARMRGLPAARSLRRAAPRPRRHTRVEESACERGHVIRRGEARLPPPRQPPYAAMSAALAAGRGLRSLSSRFARGGGAPLRAALAASPVQPRPFRTSLVVEMGRRAAKIANRKARSRRRSRNPRAPRQAHRSAPVSHVACRGLRRRALTWRRAGQGGYGACEAVRPRGEADRGRVRARPRAAAGRSRRCKTHVS